MASPLTAPFRRFLFAHAAAALSMGIQIVVLAWLAVSILALPAAQVGWVQAANLLPGLAIILLAGALADRWGPGYLLLAATAGVGLAHALTAWALFNDALGFPGLMLYAAALGTGNAVIQPAREKLLVAVGDGVLQHTLSRASALQFSAQGAGVLLASTTEVAGAGSLVAFQALLALVGMVFYAGLRGRARDSREPFNSSLSRTIGCGLKSAWAHRVIRQLLLLIAFNGFTHMGVFVVLLPWLAHNVYGLTSVGYGGLQFVFLAGTITAHVVLLKRPRIPFPGQGALFCLVYAGFIEFALAMGPTLPGLYILVACWGGIAGSSAGLSRVVLQTVSADQERGRLMSLYQLALFGMAPLGALAAGYGVSHWGYVPVLRVAGGCSLVLFGLFLFSRVLWGVRQPEE